MNRALAVTVLLALFLLALAPASWAQDSGNPSGCAGPVAGKYCRVYKVVDNKCQEADVPDCCRNNVCEADPDKNYSEDYGTCPADCPPTSLEFDVQNPAAGETFYLGEKGLLKLGLSSSGFPVVGAEIEVTGLPGPKFYLYNDGSHEDGTNFDNVYANRYSVDASMAPGPYPVKFVARFRKLEITKDFVFVVDPKITADVQVKDKYRLGDTVDLSGTLLKKSEPTPIQLEAKVLFGNETKYSEAVTADSSGHFDAAYHLSTIDPVGKWKATLTGKDSLGNELNYSKEFTVLEPKTKTELKLAPSVPNNTSVKRGEKLPVTVTVTDEEGKKIAGATVKVTLPDGQTVALEEKGDGLYAADLDIGFDFPSGTQKLEFTAVGTIDNLPAEGLTRLQVLVESGQINAEVLEPTAVHYRIGDPLTAKLRLTYPDGSKVQEADVKLVVNGQEASLTALETGEFAGTYYLQEKDQGPQTLKFTVKDKNGNQVEKTLEIEVTGESIGFVLQKNWLLVLIGLVVIVGGGGMGYLKFTGKKSKDKLVSRRQQLKSLIEELNSRYYEEGSLPKSEYQRLTDKYGEELELVERDLGAGE